MYHKQLVTHIFTKMSQGMTRADIEVELAADGWSPADIDEAFRYSAQPEELSRFSITRALHSEVSVGTTVLLALVMIVVFATVFILFGKKVVSYDLNPPAVPPQHHNLTYGAQPALSDPDFFSTVKKEFVAKRATFIEADLSDMKLRLYTEGAVSFEIPIDSKGREGSWWETPAGLYKINTKEEKHFSSIGNVWMPWSLGFQGNFFIHGRTSYPDGTPTSKEYTGGCIRLLTDDAERVFRAVSVGTPILVHERGFYPDNFTYTNTYSPAVSASHYLAADLYNNHVISQKKSNELVSIASITKLMTALIATEYINLERTLTIVDKDLVPTSVARLEVGKAYTAYQLLFPLLLESSNEAAEAIARSYGRQAFIDRMNEKAVAIGMKKTSFVDPSGVGAGNQSTAEDLFMLAKYIYNNRSFIFNITANKVANSAYGTHGFADIKNVNYMTTHSSFVGGKNGKTTAAGETNLSVFSVPVGVGSSVRPLVVIVLGSSDARTDTERLSEYAFTLVRH